MPIPLVDTGYDVPLVSLEPMVPYTPATTPTTAVERGYGVGGAIHEQSHYVIFHWDFVEDEVEYLALLTQFNLHLSDYEQVTVYVKNSRLQWQRFSGFAQLPLPQTDMKWTQMFPRDIDIIVVDLVPHDEP